MAEDILKQVQTVLKASLSAIKYTHPIRNVERIPGVKMISLQYGFPAIGILDGGEIKEGKASSIIVTEIVHIAVYVDVLGDQEKCMDEAREILENVITELRKNEHYRTGGAFAGYSRAYGPRISEMKTAYTAEDLNPVLLKLARIEFKKQEVNN